MPTQHGRCTMRTLLQVAIAGLFVTLSACALFVPNQSLYLQSAQDRATQEEVRQRLGVPHSTKSTSAGESVWLYEVRELEPGSQNSWARSACISRISCCCRSRSPAAAASSRC